MHESLTRRTVLAAGCGAACAATLTACASYGSGGPAAAPAPTPAPAPAPSGAPAPTGAAPTGGAASGGAPALAAVADVPVGGGVVLAAQQLVVTQPQAGTFKAFSAVCTHQGCAVNEVAGGTINCPCHGSKFAITDGAPTKGPAKKPLAETAVTVQGTSVVRA